MGNFIIIDNTANHRNCYIDGDGDEYNIDNVHTASFFATSDDAQAWLDEWDAEIKRGEQNGKMSKEWAQIVDADAHGLLPDMQSTANSLEIGDILSR